MALAVAVVFAVGFIVLFVVGNEIVERETVMTGDEVDARARATAGGLVEVRGTGQPRCEFAEGCGFAPPVVTHSVAILPVPLGPQTWKIPDLVSAFTDVP